MLSELAPIIEVVVIEDDPGDALLAEEYLEEEYPGRFDVRWSKTLAEGIDAIRPSTHCVLLDLGLPDAQGVGAVEKIRAVAPRIPVVVLTGFNDRAAGTKAVRAGAQDYLAKVEATPATLTRSIAYAIARAGNEERDLQLLEAELRRQENVRLTFGLKPQLLVRDQDMHCVSLYEPADAFNQLGGDFLDAVELPDGTVRMVLGDVAGHGPEEAALGVSLRVGWRSLVLNGSSECDTLGQLEQLIRVERTDPFTFATVCDVTIRPDRRSAAVCVAGHPCPLVIDADGSRLLRLPPGLPLGIEGPTRSVDHVELNGDWTMLLFSDGIFEGRDRRGGRFGLDAFVDEACRRLEGRTADDERLRGLVVEAEARNGGPLEDDVALLACSWSAR